MAARLVAKVCSKCGRASKVRPRERRCKHQNFGKGSYACWGLLIKPVSPVVAATTTPTEKSSKSVTLESKLSKAMQEIDDGLRRVRTTLSAIARWQKRAKRIQKRITYRDHPELVPEKRERVKKLRSIRLPEDTSE